MKTPILQKSMDIVQMVLALKEYIDIEEEQPRRTMDSMIKDAMLIPPKLATAMSADQYSLQMENAAIISDCTQQVLVKTMPFGGISPHIDEYLQLLRNEINQFRKLFLDWVEGLDS